MKLIIDIPEEQIPTKQELMDVSIHFVDSHVAEVDGFGFMEVSNNVTNGEVIESIFRHTEYNKYVKKIACATTVMKEWWDKPYKGVEE